MQFQADWFIYYQSSLSLALSHLSLLESGMLILKCIWKCKGVKLAKTILKERNKVSGTILQDIKIYHKPVIIKIV